MRIILSSAHHKTDDVPGDGRGRGANTKSQIIEAACELIGEKGYEGLTSAALIERAGISKGGLYHHFECLDDVVIAAYEKTAKDLYSVLGAAKPKNLDDYLEQVERMLFQHLLNDPKTLRIMHELMPKAMFDPVFAERCDSMLESGLDTMSDKFSDTFKRKVKKSDLKLVLNGVSIFLTGLAAQSQTGRSLADSRRSWRWFRSMVNDRLG